VNAIASHVSTAHSGDARRSPEMAKAPKSASVSELFLAIVVAGAALVDLPARLHLGPISGLAALTVLFTALAAVLCLVPPRLPRHVLRALSGFLVFLLWASLMSLRHVPTKLGAQNLTVITGSVLLTLLTARLSCRSPAAARRLGHMLRWSIVPAGVLFLVSRLGVDLTGLAILTVGERSFPLFSLVPLAWCLADWRSGRRRSFWIAVAILFLILVSLARTALVVGMGAFVLAHIRPRMRASWIKAAALSIVALVILSVAVLHYEPLRDRFFGYDASWSIGGIAINVMGRGKMWAATWASFLESPWFGKGPGSSAQAVSSAVPSMSHPHNDYLRLLHDYGIIGLTLWLIAGVIVLQHVWTGWSRCIMAGAIAMARVYQAAFLSLVAVLVTMITDNTLAYMFVMYPLAISLGLALGLRM